MRPIDPSLRTRRVQVTRGFGGTEVVAETLIRGRGLSQAIKWLLSHVPDPQHIKPFNRYILKDDSVIVDYGSYTYFGFIVPVNETRNTNTKETTMSKKKPYSRVENGKLLRKLQFEAARDAKTLVKEGAPEWFVRLHEEYIETVTRIAKLEDFLWVRDTKDSEARVSDEAKAVCPKAYKLLLKQTKAMFTYAEILKARLDLGWPKTPGVCECKKDEKKPAAKKASVKKTK